MPQRPIIQRSTQFLVAAALGFPLLAIAQNQELFSTLDDPVTACREARVEPRARDYLSVLACEKAIERRPQDLHLRLKLADALALYGRKQQAINTVDAALALDPQSVEANIRSGELLQQFGNRDSAKHKFLTAAELAFKNDSVAYNKALVAIAQIAREDGNPVDAIEILRKVLTRSPSLGIAKLELGKALIGLDKNDEAATVLRDAITDINIEGEGNYALGLALVRGSSKEDPIPYFQRAVALSPTAEVYSALAEQYLKIEKLKESQEVICQAVSRGLAKAETYLTLSNVFGKLEPNDPVRGALALREAVTLNRRDFDSRKKLGRLLLQIHLDDEALRIYREGYELRPNDAELRKEFASLLKKKVNISDTSLESYLEWITKNISESRLNESFEWRNIELTPVVATFTGSDASANLTVFYQYLATNVPLSLKPAPVFPNPCEKSLNIDIKSEALKRRILFDSVPPQFNRSVHQLKKQYMKILDKRRAAIEVKLSKLKTYDFSDESPKPSQDHYELIDDLTETLALLSELNSPQVIVFPSLRYIALQVPDRVPLESKPPAEVKQMVCTKLRLQIVGYGEPCHAQVVGGTIYFNNQGVATQFVMPTTIYTKARGAIFQSVKMNNRQLRKNSVSILSQRSSIPKTQSPDGTLSSDSATGITLKDRSSAPDTPASPLEFSTIGETSDCPKWHAHSRDSLKGYLSFTAGRVEEHAGQYYKAMNFHRPESVVSTKPGILILDMFPRGGDEENKKTVSDISLYNADFQYGGSKLLSGEIVQDLGALAKEVRKLPKEKCLMQIDEPLPEQGHGLAVAGVMAAKPNLFGIVGIAYDSDITFMRSGAPDSVLYTDLDPAISYALESAAEGSWILNGSFSFGNRLNETQRDLLEEKIINTRHKILYVFANNDTGRPISDNCDYYPECWGDQPNVIAVAGLGPRPDQQPSIFVNKDGKKQEGEKRTNGSDFGARKMALAAPAYLILSTDVDNSYSFRQGSSVAAAFVSGAASIVMREAIDLHRPLEPYQVKQRLVSTSRLTDNLEIKITAGRKMHAVRGGVLDIKRAVTNLVKDVVVMSDNKEFVGEIRPMALPNNGLQFSLINLQSVPDDNKRLCLWKDILRIHKSEKDGPGRFTVMCRSDKDNEPGKEDISAYRDVYFWPDDNDARLKCLGTQADQMALVASKKNCFALHNAVSVSDGGQLLGEPLPIDLWQVREIYFGLK